MITVMLHPSLMSLHSPPPLTSAPRTSQGLEVVLAWKINDVTEEPLSAESLLEHLWSCRGPMGSNPDIIGNPKCVRVHVNIVQM